MLALAVADVAATGVSLLDFISRYDSTLWLAWATLGRPDGGGLCESAPGLPSLKDDDLLEGVVEFLTWLATPVDPHNPLVARRYKEAGKRSTANPLGTKGVDYHARAYLDWRRTVLRPSEWSARELLAMADLTQARSNRRRRVELTLESLGACLDVLDACQVVSIADPIRSQAWHAREKAALLVRIWGVLRTSELVRLSDDLTVTDWGLQTTLFQTKSNSTRFIRLPARGDRLCPVRALAEWLNAALEAGYDRGGRLLPVVLQQRQNGSIISRGGASERNNARRIFEAAGLTEGLGSDDILGLHNFRSLLPTAAADRGHSSAFLQSLGAWAGRHQAGQSYVSDRDGVEEARVIDGLGSAE